MRIVLHPHINEQIDIEAYWMKFGHRPLLQTDSRPRVRCPFCPQTLIDVAGKTGSTCGHFAHLPDSGYCPSKVPAGRPYLRLTPSTPDPEWANQLKVTFFENWQRYYTKLEDLIPLLSLAEFFALVTEANRLGIWEYRHLESWEIPYVFVLLADFSARTSRKKNGKPLRKYWFRFWYNSAIKKLDDLWIWREAEPILYRASFEQPRRHDAIPKYEDIVKFYPIERDQKYLVDAEVADVPDWVAETVTTRLPGMLWIA